MAHQEIERKFLVDGEYKSLAHSKTHIEQGYFETAPGRTVRVRIRDDRGFLTIKGPSDSEGLSRYEFETEIPLDDAREMMALCRPGRVVKDRWLIACGNHTIEVDEFFGDNEGLVVAEVELTDPRETFIRPPFLGREVTGDKRYYNKRILNHPYKEWKSASSRAILKDYRFTAIAAFCVLVLSTIPVTDEPLADVPFVDKWVHMLMYACLVGAVWADCFVRRHREFRLSHAALAVTGAAVFGGLMELVQLLLPYRSGDWLDAAANTFGASVSGLVLAVLSHRIPKTHNHNPNTP